MIVTEQDPDSFGRYLAWIYAADTGEYLNQVLVEQGHAVEYRP
jgi:endonuclease YncB( thermonuclease family)